MRSEALDRSVRGLAHDLNNVLAIVVSHIDLLGALVPDDVAFTQRIHAITSAVAHGESLTERLLDLGREEAAVDLVDINAVVVAMTDLIRDGLGHRVDIAVELAAQRSWARVPARDLERIVLNLVANAVEVMGDGGRLGICTETVLVLDDHEPQGAGRVPGPFVVVHVTDTGPGMDPITQRLVFEPFFTAKSNGSAHGMGLQTCQQIATENCGWIEVDTEPGVGSTFSLFLPQAEVIEPADDGPPVRAPTPVVGVPGTVVARPHRSEGAATVSAARAPAPAPAQTAAPAPPRRRYWALRERLPVPMRTWVRGGTDLVGARFVGSVTGARVARVDAPAAPLALTFDDGPHPDVTPWLLDALGELDVRVTFFVLADAARTWPRLVRRAVAEGHEIGLHGLDHGRLSGAGPAAVCLSVAAGCAALADITGQVPRLFRPPFGSQSLVSYGVTRALGLTPVLWDGDAEDWIDAPVEQVADRALAAAHAGGILLLHEVARSEPGRPAPVTTFDRVDLARRVVVGLRAHDLEPTSVSSLLDTAAPRRTVWFRP